MVGTEQTQVDGVRWGKGKLGVIMMSQKDKSWLRQPIGLIHKG